MNYCITRKELAAMIFGLKNYSSIYWEEICGKTDHDALTYLRSARDLIGQQARWLDLLEEFDFEIKAPTGASMEMLIA